MNYLSTPRRLLRRLRDRLTSAGPDRFQPVFDDAAFMQVLQADSRHAIARHFRTRRTPAFFVQPREVSALINRFRLEQPEWHDAMRARVRADVETGLPIYAHTGPPLDGDFPWNDLPPGPGDDGLYSKRPHRFAFAPRTALIAHSEPKTADRFRAVLEGWQTTAAGTCRYCHDSPLAVIQRILALSWAWVFLAGRPESTGPAGLDLEYLVLKILWSDCAYLAPRLGDAFPNNHLLADAFAVWYLQTVFPELAQATGIDGDPDALWLQELSRQVHPDGTGFEHSAHYHEFAAEMGAAYILLSRLNDQETPPWAVERVRAMLHFQSALTGPEAIPVCFGNAVEDTLFPVDPGEGWCSGSLRELDRALFSPDIRPAEQTATDVMRAWWLLGGNLQPPAALTSQLPQVQHFEQGGFVVMNQRNGDRLIFRSGPAPDVELIAGHMHADLLSIHLSLGERPLIIDAGTYSYRRASSGWPDDEPAWRDYLAGPVAHNGPYLAGEDPLGPLQADFRPSDTTVRVETRTMAGAGLAWTEGTIVHGGSYNQTRRGILQIDNGYWLVCDLDPPASPRKVRSVHGFQFSQGSQVIQTTPGSIDFRIHPLDEGPGLRLLASTGSDAWQLLEGSRDPTGGWVSRSYGRLESAPQLRFFGDDGTTAFLLVSDKADKTVSGINRIEARLIEHNVVLVILKGPDSLEYILVHFGNDASHTILLDNGMRFEGRIFRVRIESNQIVSLQWLDGTSFDWPEKEFSAKPSSKPGHFTWSA